jgi:hypothetical protein
MYVFEKLGFFLDEGRVVLCFHVHVLTSSQLRQGAHKNTASNSSSIVARVPLPSDGYIYIFHYSDFTAVLSESELLYDWRFTTNVFVLATSPLRFTTSILFPAEQLRS